MLHRSIKFVHAAVLAFSAILAFLLLRHLDGRWVMGHTAVVWATDSTGATSGSQVTTSITEFAASHRATIARETPTSRSRTAADTSTSPPAAPAPTGWVTAIPHSTATTAPMCTPSPNSAIATRAATTTSSDRTGTAKRAGPDPHRPRVRGSGLPPVLARTADPDVLRQRSSGSAPVSRGGICRSGSGAGRPCMSAIAAGRRTAPGSDSSKPSWPTPTPGGSTGAW